jgi:hypothetical protein
VPAAAPCATTAAIAAGTASDASNALDRLALKAP